MGHESRVLSTSTSGTVLGYIAACDSVAHARRVRSVISFRNRRSLPATGLLANTGYLTWLLPVFFLFAAWLHHVSRLPHSFPWLQPLKILKGVAQREWFPELALVALVFGATARRGLPPMRESLSHFSKRLRSGVPNDVVIRCGIGFLIGAIGAPFFSKWYNISDYVAAGIVLGAGAHALRTRQALVRALSDVAIAVILFSAASYIFTVIKALLFTVGSIEDNSLVQFEEKVFGVPLHRPLTAWAKSKPKLVIALDDIYFRLFEHMALTSLFLVGARLRRERTRLWCALAICYLIGGPAYYIIPGLGPRFFEADLYGFMRTLPLASNGVQQALFYNTRAVAEGRASVLSPYAYLACMPSLHLSHEFVLLYYARHSVPWFLASLIFTSLTVVAVLVLGWHYAIDIAGGAVLSAIAIGIVYVSRDRLLPRVVFQRGCYVARRRWPK